jgi:hypothetical protein
MPKECTIGTIHHHMAFVKPPSGGCDIHNHGKALEISTIHGHNSR